jgi:ABC-type phosphate transport system permease subunit
LTTQVTGISDALQYATALVLVGLVACVNAVSIVLRIRLRSSKRW